MAYASISSASDIYASALKNQIDRLSPDMQARVAKVLIEQVRSTSPAVLSRVRNAGNGIGDAAGGGWGDLVGSIGAALITTTGSLFIAKENNKAADKEASRQADLIKQQAAAQVEAAKAMAASQVQQSQISAAKAIALKPVFIIGGVAVIGLVGLLFYLRRRSPALPAPKK